MLKGYNGCQLTYKKYKKLITFMLSVKDNSKKLTIEKIQKLECKVLNF